MEKEQIIGALLTYDYHYPFINGDKENKRKQAEKFAHEYLEYERIREEIDPILLPDIKNYEH